MCKAVSWPKPEPANRVARNPIPCYFQPALRSHNGRAPFPEQSGSDEEKSVSGLFTAGRFRPQVLGAHITGHSGRTVGQTDLI